jgi:glycosidase
MLALMQTTLGGTMYLYQGQEIGMRNFPSDWNPEIDYKDIESVNFWKKTKALYPDGSKGREEAERLLQKKARDHARTPMQWDDSPNAGFTVPEATPWMRVNDDYKSINVKAQQSLKWQTKEELSIWQYWQHALQHRKLHKDVFIYGDFEELDHENERIFAYLRTEVDKKETWLVVMNWTTDEIEWTIPAGIDVKDWASSTLSTHIISVKPTIKLQAFEGVLGVCK